METLDESDEFWSWKDLLWTIAPRLKCPRGWQAYCPFQRLNSFGKIFSPGSCNCVCEISVHSIWAPWLECFPLNFAPWIESKKDIHRFSCTNANYPMNLRTPPLISLPCPMLMSYQRHLQVLISWIISVAVWGRERIWKIFQVNNVAIRSRQQLPSITLRVLSCQSSTLCRSFSCWGFQDI